MADLPIFADRVNDIEVAANAPVTESVNRKYGSNINYLLDFLGIADGSTSAAGTLSDFIQAVEEVSTHTMDLQANIFANGASQTQSIGTYTRSKFVNQVFYLVKNGAPPQGNSIENIVYGATPVFSDWIELFQNKDATGNQGFGSTFKMLEPVDGFIVQSNYGADQSQVSPVRNDWNSNREFSKMLHPGIYNYENGLFRGDGLGFLDGAILPVLELDYRDTGTSTEVFMTNLINMGGGGTSWTMWRGKKLNVGFNL